MNGSNKKLLDFWATWCQPCKAMAAVIEELEKDFAGQIYKFDIDVHQDMVNKYDILSVPTYLLTDKNDKEIKRFVGVTPKETLEKALRD